MMFWGVVGWLLWGAVTVRYTADYWQGKPDWWRK